MDSRLNSAVLDNNVDDVEALLKSEASPDASVAVCYRLSDSFYCLSITNHSILGISCTCDSL